jgi:hypothetical protein
MSRPLSPDELDLEPEILSDDDMSAWIASIESDPVVLREEADMLGSTARRVLAACHDKPHVATSRTVSKSTMARLERRGLAKQHDKAWQLTDFGKKIGGYLATASGRIKP